MKTEGQKVRIDADDGSLAREIKHILKGYYEVRDSGLGNTITIWLGKMSEV